MSDNLLDPVVLEDGEIKGFVRDHCCGLCGSHLVIYPTAGRKWITKCPEHGVIMPHMVAKKTTTERVKRNQRKADLELNPLSDEQKKAIFDSLGI